MTHALTIAAPTETFDRKKFRTVKITTLRGAPSNTPFFVELHDEKGTVRRVLGYKFNNVKPVKAWEGDDGAMVSVEGRGTVQFINHTYAGPKYPVAHIVNSKTGNVRNVRMTFLVEIDTPTTEIEKQILATLPPETPHVPTVEAELVENDPVETHGMTKPVKTDYANFGEYMTACKKFKAWEREQANKSTELAVV